MSFLTSVTVPKSTGFLAGVQMPKAPVLTPVKNAPSVNSFSSLTNPDVGTVANSTPSRTVTPTPNPLSAIIDQFTQGIKDAAAGSGPNGNTAMDALDLANGIVTSLFAPMAPVGAALSQVVQTAGQGYATIPAVQNFANSPAGEAAMNAADIISKISNIAGAVAGGFASPKVEIPEVPVKLPVTHATANPIPVHTEPFPVENSPTVIREAEALPQAADDSAEKLKTEISIYEDAQANDPAKGLLKYYGRNDPRYSNLDDIFSRNVGNGKSGSLDSKVTELGFNDVQQAHDAVIQYLDTKDTIAQMKNTLAGIKTENPTTKTTTQTLKPIEGTGDIKIRGLSQGVEATAIEKQLTDTFGDLPEYQQVSMKEQAQAAAEYLASKPDEAMAVALGNKAPPKGLLPESVFVAAEQKAIAEGDVQGLRDLANSKLAGSATTMGQRIRTLGERDSASPLSAIREVQDARAKAQAARGQSVDTEVAKAQKVIRQANTKQSWSSFVDSITC